MSPKREAKLHSIQVENNSSGSMKMASLLIDLKTPPQNFFVIPDGPFEPLASLELSETLVSCKSCEIGRLKTVPVRR